MLKVSTHCSSQKYRYYTGTLPAIYRGTSVGLSERPTEESNEPHIANHVAHLDNRKLQIVAQNQWHCGALNASDTSEEKFDTNKLAYTPLHTEREYICHPLSVACLCLPVLFISCFLLGSNTCVSNRTFPTVCSSRLETVLKFESVQ